MTRKELSQVNYLKHDLHRAELILDELKASVQPKSQKVNGMPFQNTGETSDPTSDTAIKIQYYEDIVKGYKASITIRSMAIDQWLNDMDDDLLRAIITYRCIECLPWECVAIRIGGGNTADSVRKYFFRHTKTKLSEMSDIKLVK